MDKDELPKYSLYDEKRHGHRAHGRSKRLRRRVLGIALLALLYLGYTQLVGESHSTHSRPGRHHGQDHKSLLSIDRLQKDFNTCRTLASKPSDPSGPRERSARYIDGHRPVLIRNATIWTGEPVAGTSEEDARLGKGYSWGPGLDVYLEYGLIKKIGASLDTSALARNITVYDAKGRQLTSGIVDMHSHVGVGALPSLGGWEDVNELSNDITPYVRSIDGFSPLDHQLQVIKSGGVTTSLVLPGSGNNMGGQAYVFKHAVGKADGREEISAEDMLADPEKHWRYMKMACGENAKRVYGRVGSGGPFSRLGEAYAFRHAFEQASALISAQDDWCSAAAEVGVEKMTTYLPQAIEWESLGALLRGQVLLNVHCYTVPDLEMFVGLTNEFNFSVRAFHHAHQTFLVPEILKRAYGGVPPASALFADNMYYKAEAYVASEQAGKILWENGLTPVYVSDGPVLNSQHVLFEAAKAYKNGLPYHVALAGVTSASAKLLGLGERIGKVKEGFDADVVVWDSDPLAVGATPVQVWIDGTPQFDAVELKKPLTKPIKPSQYLQDIKSDILEHQDVVFTGLSKVLLPRHEMVASDQALNVVVQNGTITCVGACDRELLTAQHKGTNMVALHNGHLAPSLTSFGSSLGLVEIPAELDTQDGFHSDQTFGRAVDGLALDTKNLKAAYSHGVTKAISAPLFDFGGFKGVSVGFSTGALHSLEHDAVWLDEVALHYAITRSTAAPALSKSIAVLRSKLMDAVTANDTAENDHSEASYLRKAVKGQIALAISVHSADLIASFLRVKVEVESAIAKTMDQPKQLRVVLLGGGESWMLAKELAQANVGVVLAPLQTFSESWSERRSLVGAPYDHATAIDVLHAASVKVAIGTKEDWEVRDLYLQAGIAHVNSNGKINETEALALVSSNIYGMLGIEKTEGRELEEFVVFDGSPLEIDGRIRAIADGRRRVGVFV